MASWRGRRTRSHRLTGTNHRGHMKPLATFFRNRGQAAILLPLVPLHLQEPGAAPVEPAIVEASAHGHEDHSPEEELIVPRTEQPVGAMGGGQTDQPPPGGRAMPDEAIMAWHRQIADVSWYQGSAWRGVASFITIASAERPTSAGPDA